MTTPRFNFVRFVPSGLGEGEGAPVLRLSLESAWHLACGIEPDVNTAIVPAGDFEILRERMAAREAAGDPARPPAALLTGAVEMRMAGAGQADYRIAPITIVEAEPATIAPALAGDLQRSARAYRVYLADMRHNWIAPRGGNLRIGLVNRRDDPDPRPNTRLIEICLSLMGLAGTAGPPRYIDPDLDSLPPVRDLDWRGAHAPTELWRICQELGATIAITSDGGVRVELEGRGPAPLVPAERSLGALEPVVPLLPGSALSAPATAPPVGSPVKWGKVAESWNNGNTVLLTPCAGQQDGTPTGQSVLTPEDYDGAVDDAEWQGNTTYTFPKWTLQQMFQSMGITGWTRMPRGGSPTTSKAQVRDYVTADLFNEIMKALDRMEVMELENPVWYHWNEEDEEWVQGLYVFGPPQMYYYEQYYGPESGWKSSLAEAKAQAEGAWESVPGASYPGPSIFQRWAGLQKRIYPYPPEDPDNPVYQWVGTAGHVAPSAEATVGLGVVLNNRPSAGTVYIYWSGRATTEPTWDENSVFDDAGYPIREDSLTLLESDSFSSGGPQTFVVEITMGESPPSFPTWPNGPPDPTDDEVTTSAAGWMERSRKALVRWNFTRLTPMP